MAVTHEAATRNAIADAVLAQIDLQAAAGYIEFQAGSVEVATCVLQYPAGVVAGAVLTFTTPKKHLPFSSCHKG